jgi:hypothetical protein
MASTVIHDCYVCMSNLTGPRHSHSVMRGVSFIAITSNGSTVGVRQVICRTRLLCVYVVLTTCHRISPDITTRLSRCEDGTTPETIRAVLSQIFEIYIPCQGTEKERGIIAFLIVPHPVPLTG